MATASIQCVLQLHKQLLGVQVASRWAKGQCWCVGVFLVQRLNSLIFNGSTTRVLFGFVLMIVMIGGHAHSAVDCSAGVLVCLVLRAGDHVPV